MPKPARMATLSLTTSSCASRLVTSGTLVSSLRMTSTFLPADRRAVLGLVKLHRRIDLLAGRGLLAGHRQNQADLDGVLCSGGRGEQRERGNGRDFTSQHFVFLSNNLACQLVAQKTAGCSMLPPPKAREHAHEKLQGRRIRQAAGKSRGSQSRPAGQRKCWCASPAAGVCHSDVHLWEGYFDMGGGNKYSTEKTMAPPRTMGHEIVGDVVAIGPDAKGAKVGDKAVVYPWIGCGKCWYCQNGIEHLCPTPRALGVNKDGGYADHVLVPDAKYLYPYGNLPTELACLYACSGITAFGAVKKAVGQDGGKPILVIGAGGVGLMGVALRQVRAGPRADRGRHRRRQAQARPREWRDRRPRSARQGSPQAGDGTDRRHRRWRGHRFRRRRGVRPSSASGRSAAAGG